MGRVDLTPHSCLHLRAGDHQATHLSDPLMAGSGDRHWCYGRRHFQVVLGSWHVSRQMSRCVFAKAMRGLGQQSVFRHIAPLRQLPCHQSPSGASRSFSAAFSAHRRLLALHSVAAGVPRALLEMGLLAKRKAGPTPEERRAKAAKLELQSLRQKYLAHKEELIELVKEHPDLTPYVLKRALQLKDLKKLDPTGWATTAEKWSADTPQKAKQESHNSGSNVGEGEGCGGGMAQPVTSAETPTKQEPDADDRNSFEERAIDRRHNKLENFGASDLEALLFRVDPACNPYVLKSVVIRGQNRQNKERLLEIAEILTGVPPYETFNSAAFGKMKELVNFLKGKRVELGQRGATLSWPPDWANSRCGVYHLVRLTSLPGWGVRNRFSGLVATMTAREAAKIDPNKAYFETNFSDNRACLKLPNSTFSKLVMSMTFSDKHLQHLCHADGPAFGSAPSTKAADSTKAERGASDDDGGNECGTPTSNHKQTSGKDNDPEIGAGAIAAATKVVLEDGGLKDAASLPGLAKPVGLVSQGFDEVGFVPPAPASNGAKIEDD